MGGVEIMVVTARGFLASQGRSNFYILMSREGVRGGAGGACALPKFWSAMHL